MYDLIIVGAGPAGITASIYAARKRMNFLVITGNIGGQTLWTTNIENYTGYQFITGAELVQKFIEQLEQSRVQLRQGEKVLSIKKESETLKVTTDKAAYEARAIVIASGKIPRKLGIPGEEEYRNKGVAYCAACDAPLFSGMDVAVAGGGNSALDATLQLVNIARRIHLIDASPRFKADPVMIEKIESSDKVAVYHAASIERIYGDSFVRGLTVSQAGKSFELPVQGLFVEIGYMPASDFDSDISRNAYGEIMVNCNSQTSVPGLFAAGDVTDVSAKQIIVACGEGAKATIAAFSYLERQAAKQEAL